MAEAEGAAGNFIVALTTKWLCTNKGCYNLTYTCWIEGTDLARDHYPVSGEILRAWSEEIKRGDAEVDAPSARTVIRLANSRSRDRKNQEKEKAEPATAPLRRCRRAHSPCPVRGSCIRR